MQLRIVFLFGQCMYLCNLFVFSKGKAIVGQNVRSAQAGEFPYVVSIARRTKSNHNQCEHYCTGTLVSNRDVLTAAHCIENKTTKGIRVIAGSVDLREGQRYRVTSLLTYMEWVVKRNKTPVYAHNDIGMIRLQKNVSDIQPAEITYLKAPLLAGYNAILTGWGRKEDDTTPLILQVAEVGVLEMTDCNNRMTRLKGKNHHFDETIYLCTFADPYALNQQGDSGGPLLYTNIILGITIGGCPFPNTRIHPEKVNVHHALYLYRSFIFDTIQNF